MDKIYITKPVAISATLVKNIVSTNYEIMEGTTTFAGRYIRVDILSACH